MLILIIPNVGDKVSHMNAQLIGSLQKGPTGFDHKLMSNTQSAVKYRVRTTQNFLFVKQSGDVEKNGIQHLNVGDYKNN